MTEDPSLHEYPVVEAAPSQKTNNHGQPAAPARQSRIAALWEGISQAGLAEGALRLGTHVLLLALILTVAWAMRQFYRTGQVESLPQSGAPAAIQPTATALPLPPRLPEFRAESAAPVGVSRDALLHTTLPNRPRMEVSRYTVVKGDTIFGIAEKFGLKPETLLWANQYTLGDNPHNLRPDQELNILPVDGAYYQWQPGDGLNGVAKFFEVKPEDIVAFIGNNLNPETIGDFARPNIEPGTWLVIPGGRREFVSWSAPAISRDNPGVARVLGPGACSAVSDGAVGVGLFIWPANNHFLSGFDYAPNANHPGIDIDGNTGDAVYAIDNGVVVYAGWNNWGYGNMVVINHGNGWQSLYAHLSAYNVSCGQSVYQTNVIGAIGSTGNSTGSHLHFEMMYNGAKVNPWDYLP
ncbi:MAG: M23 family metallopeptidase [Chloroflexi bacterium]|nr:M23 family metallopeptidase [Chloroflexota bacterium]